MGLSLDDIDGQTPIDEEEKEELLIKTISTRGELDDCKYWIENSTFHPDEIAIRFSHRLVRIHLFPNGNGRHSRLIADILVSNIFDRPVFTWGHSDLSKKDSVRKEYLNAIYKADYDDYDSLIKFARK